MVEKVWDRNYEKYVRMREGHLSCDDLGMAPFKKF